MNFYTNSLPILEKLFVWVHNDAFKAIMNEYKTNKHAIINFLYFTNSMKYKLFEYSDKKTDLEYKSALKKWSFILPDGIAIELFYKVASYFNKTLSPRWLTNLNGTDFMPYFITNLLKEESSVHIAIYSTYDPKINKSKSELEKAKKNFEKKYSKKIDYSEQSLYSERGKDFDFWQYQLSLNTNQEKVNIFITCLWTPVQELRIEKNKEFFVKNNIIVFNAWGFIDFLSWYEKRAPQRLVKARVLETPRRVISNPKKNLKKLVAMFAIIRFRYKKIMYVITKN